MIKMLNACTTKIDDAEDAVKEIREQLALENRLLKNSVAIIACFSECIETGVVAALCENLPFDVVGCTTLGSSACGKYGTELLSISVLTSDDVTFSTAMSGSISQGNIVPSLDAAYETARQGKEPDFILVYCPIMFGMGEKAVAGSAGFKAFNSVVKGKPMFGTFSCDHTLDGAESRVIRNGKYSIDAAAMILMFGKVAPKFYVSAIPEVNVMRQTAVVTESNGTLIREISGMNPIAYLKTLGIARKNVEITGFVVFLVNYNDGTAPVVMATYGVTAEDYLICGCDVPVNSILSVCSLKYHGILESAEATIKQISELGAVNGILMYSCLSRNMLLGANADDEMKKVLELLGEKYPYQLSYAGGEVCPLLDKTGKPINHFHNFSFIVCVF
jgi:hypothetical protein